MDTTNNTTHYIVDLVGARPGTEETTISRLLESLPDTVTVSYLARMNQEFSAGEAAVHRVLDEILTDDHRSLQRAVEVVDNHRAPDRALVFWSFLARTTNGVKEHFKNDSDVDAQPLSRLLFAHPSASDLLAAGSMTADEVLSAALRVMAARADGRVKQVDLRTLMTADNPIFDKQSGPSEWKAAGFVKTVLAQLEQRGLIRVVDGAGTVNALVEITPAGRNMISAPVPVTVPGSVVEGVGKDPTVQIWWDLLIQAGWNPWAKLGDTLFEALEEVVTTHPGEYVASELVRHAVTTVRKSGSVHAPWSVVERWLMQVLQIEQVLIAESGPIAAKYGPAEPKVLALHEQFAERIRVRHIVMLVSLGAEVDYTDVWRLSAVLFGTRSREHDAQKLLDLALTDGMLVIDAYSGRLSSAPAVPQNLGTATTVG